MAIPILLVPGLNCTAEIFQHQLPAIWTRGPVTIADTRTGDSMAEIAAAILRDAPPRFALAGFSMGGYISFEILRQARDRVMGLALLDTTARPDSLEATERRRAGIALTEQGRYSLAVQQSFPNSVHPSHVGDPGLKALHMRMAAVAGPEAYVRHQGAIIARPDSRPDLSIIAVPTLVVVGEADAITPPDAAREMAETIAGARLVIVPNSGHMALAEQPDRVSEAMTNWLDSLAI